MPASPATVILTRPPGKNETLQQRFEQCGFQVITLPALKLQRLEVTAALPDPVVFDLVFFVSGYAVECYFDLLDEQAMAWPPALRVGCVGPGTAMALRQRKIATQNMMVPSAHLPLDSRGFLALLEERDALSSIRRVLIVCGTTGNPWLGSQLQARGIAVTRLPLYQRDAMAWSFAQQERMCALFAAVTEKKYVVLTSPQGIDAFVNNLATAQIAPELVVNATTFVVTHAGQIDHLKQVWQRELPDIPTERIRIVQTLPRDDAIFHTVTNSD